jgi:hypothetical protein
MGIKSTIEESTAVFRPSVKRVADIGGTSIFAGRGGYWGTIIGALIPNRDEQHSHPARCARVGSPDAWLVWRI